jgi:O-antigen/teichoic acid export membrane protein
MAVVRAGSLIAAAASGASLTTLLLVQVALAALDLVLSIYLSGLATAKLEIRRWWTVPIRALREERKQLVRFVGFTNLAALLKVLQSHLDVLLVGYFLPSTSAGYAQLARWITDAMRFLAGPVNTAAYPEYARLWDKRDAPEIRRVTRSLFGFTTVLAAGALAVVVVGAAPAIRHLAGAEYAPAIPVVYWLAIGTALEIPTAILHPMLVASEHIAWSMIALAFAIVVRIGTLVVFIGAQAELAAGIAHLTYAIAYTLFAGFATMRALAELRTR